MVKTEKNIFPVKGLHCAACVNRVQKILESHDGVQNVSVNLATSKISIEYDLTLTNPQNIKELVDNSGYELITEKAEAETETPVDTVNTAYLKNRNNTLLAASFSIPVFILSMFFPSTILSGEISAVLSGITVFIFGKSFFSRSFSQIKKGMVSMDTLEIGRAHV